MTPEQFADVVESCIRQAVAPFKAELATVKADLAVLQAREVVHDKALRTLAADRAPTPRKPAKIVDDVRL